VPPCANKLEEYAAELSTSELGRRHTYAHATPMDRGGAGSATLLRKRSLSVNTTASAAAAAIDQFGSKRQAGGVAAAVEEEPVSPTGRLFREPHFRCHIVSVFGLGAPVDLPALRAGVAATLARHPRFCSVQVRTSFAIHALPSGSRFPALRGRESCSAALFK